MRGSRGGNLCANRLYSCGSGEPCRSKPCGLRWGKVKAKTLISTGFELFLSVFTGDYRYLGGIVPLSGAWKGPFASAPQRGRPAAQDDRLVGNGWLGTAGPSLLHPGDEDLSPGTPGAQDDKFLAEACESAQCLHRPKRTFFFGLRAAARGVLRASTMGAARRK